MSELPESLKFRAEDFGGLAREDWFPEVLARMNGLLAARLGEVCKVFKCEGDSEAWWASPGVTDTDEALLVCERRLKVT